jgi:phosphatidylserine/phosphatidylglycerophosphate/cardiolipin synthase-like enzyme
VYENRHGEHSKIVLTDGTFVAFGSYNFEHAAHDRLAEAMLATRDPAAVRPALAIFDELRRHPDNVAVTAGTLRELPLRLGIKRAILGPFKRWM